MTRKWIFVHVPKCGGMSFRQQYERGITCTHDPASTLPDDARTVATIRDPLDRLCSMYAHRFGNMEGFADWLDTGRWREVPYIYVDKRGRRRRIPISEPQATWTRAETHLLRFDHYQADLDSWASMAGHPQRTLQRRNASQRETGWRQYIPRRHLSFLVDYYAIDFESLDLLANHRILDVDTA